jgi:hypothetical protein
MKKRNALFILTTVTVSSLFLFQACKKDAAISGPVANPAGMGAVKINLTDAPGNYLEVNVDIKQVRIHVSDDSTSNDGWLDLPTNAGIYNLLDLQNGIDTTVVDSTFIPAGKVSQIRFVLGPDCSVMTSDSVLHDLKVPSGEQSGLKINVHKSIPLGQALHVLLDFDAEKSIKQTGNGNFMMKPVIRVK